MALLQAEGFNLYGETASVRDTSRGFMLAAGYTAVDNAVRLAVPDWGARSDTYSASAKGGTVGLQRSIGGVTDGVLFGFGYSVDALPLADGFFYPITFYDSTGTPIGALCLNRLGNITLLDGAATVLGASFGFALPTQEWCYFEMKLDVGAGTFQLFVITFDDEIATATEVLSLTDLTFTGSGGCESYSLIRQSASSPLPSITQWIADFTVCDTSGSANATFTGSKYVATVLPVSDNATHHAWTGAPNTYPTAFANIAKPVPDDDSFIGATASGNVSQFNLPRPPSDAVFVLGVVLANRTYLGTAGSDSLKVALVGPGGAVIEGSAHTIASTTPAMVYDVFQNGPDSGTQLVPTDLLGGGVRLNRSA